MLVSAPVERFLGQPRKDLLGKTAREIFSHDSQLGVLVLDAFDRRRPFLQREFITAQGRRVQASMDFVQEQGTHIGALLTMRDAESVARIGDEIENVPASFRQRPGHRRRSPRSQESHQCHRSALATAAEQALRA